MLRNLPLLERAGSGLGAINLGFERDGVVRRVSTAVRVGDQVLAALPLELARLAGGEAAVTAVVGGSGIEAVRTGARSVPTDRHGRVWVRFSQGVSHPTVSAKQILFGEAEPGLFRDKLVLVGTTAAGVANYVPTPVGVAMPSLLIHAEVLRTILSRGPLVRPPRPSWRSC